MKPAPHVLAFLIVLATASAAPAPVPVYSVAEYDPKRDPEADLQKSIKIAAQEDRRILLVVGGNWCGWCRALDKQFKRPEVASILAPAYVIMKVNYSDENGNLFFLQDYPDIAEFPHFYILDAKGRLLHSQPNRAFERLGGYQTAAMAEFLTKWAPKRKPARE